MKYAPGVFSGNIGAGGNGAGADPNQLTDPTGIILDREGYLYVAEGFRGRVQKFPPNLNQNSNAVTVAGNYSGVAGPGPDYLQSDQHTASSVCPPSFKHKSALL